MLFASGTMVSSTTPPEISHISTLDPAAGVHDLAGEQRLLDAYARGRDGVDEEERQIFHAMGKEALEAWLARHVADVPTLSILTPRAAALLAPHCDLCLCAHLTHHFRSAHAGAAVVVSLNAAQVLSASFKRLKES